MPPISTTSTTWLADAAREAPAVVALRDQHGQELTYAELHARAERLAAAFPAGDGVIAIEADPGLTHAVAVHAAMLALRPSLTLRPGLPAREREEVLEAGAPDVVLDGSRIEQLIADSGAAPAEAKQSATAPERAPSPDAVLARVLSSGTTGARRPIDLSFANFSASAVASAANLGVEPGDVWLACMPMDHVGGLSILTRSVLQRTTALIHSRFDAEAVVAALAAEDPWVTAISLVPTQLRRLLDAGAPLAGLRFALIGGAALDRATLDAALEAGAPVVQSYGLTEACSQVCTLGPGEARAHPGSSGRALPGIEVAIEEGRIAVRGPTIAAAAADTDGWLRTADLGRLDADGFLWVAGRADDLIVSGGENVAPELVEEALLAHPAVAEAAVVGVPDPDWGEAVTAVVVAAEGAEPVAAELIAHCRERLAAPMVPKRIEVAAELPRTASGKLQRAMLRARLAGAASA